MRKSRRQQIYAHKWLSCVGWHRMERNKFSSKNAFVILLPMNSIFAKKSNFSSFISVQFLSFHFIQMPLLLFSQWPRDKCKFIHFERVHMMIIWNRHIIWKKKIWTALKSYDENKSYPDIIWRILNDKTIWWIFCYFEQKYDDHIITSQMWR